MNAFIISLTAVFLFLTSCKETEVTNHLIGIWWPEEISFVDENQQSQSYTQPEYCALSIIDKPSNVAVVIRINEDNSFVMQDTCSGSQFVGTYTEDLNMIIVKDDNDDIVITLSYDDKWSEGFKTLTYTVLVNTLPNSMIDHIIVAGKGQ